LKVAWFDPFNGPNQRKLLFESNLPISALPTPHAFHSIVTKKPCPDNPIRTVPKAVWKIFKPRNFPSQHGYIVGSLLENLYSETSKE
jgi:hypothetical protein